MRGNQCSICVLYSVQHPVLMGAQFKELGEFRTAPESQLKFEGFTCSQAQGRIG